MQLGPVKPDDIVECDVRGDRFLAFAEEQDPETRKLRIRSATRRPIPAGSVTSRQVVGHYRKSKASRV
jgi:hypothetical protein